MPLIFGSTNKHQTLAALCEELMVNEQDLVCAEQVHGNRIAVVTAKEKGQQIPGVDALVTKEKEIPLAIRTADCAPILVYDQRRKIISLIHAGRKGTESHITLKTVNLMKDKYSSNPPDLRVKIGPCIGSCCYPIDLRQANNSQLYEAGVHPKNIETNPDCTCCNKHVYFSYRGDGPETGRMFTVAML
jgi:YfiH family protein